MKRAAASLRAVLVAIVTASPRKFDDVTIRIPSGLTHRPFDKNIYNDGVAYLVASLRRNDRQNVRCLRCIRIVYCGVFGIVEFRRIHRLVVFGKRQVYEHVAVTCSRYDAERLDRFVRLTESIVVMELRDLAVVERCFKEQCITPIIACRNLSFNEHVGYCLDV